MIVECPRCLIKYTINSKDIVNKNFLNCSECGAKWDINSVITNKEKKNTDIVDTYSDVIQTVNNKDNVLQTINKTNINDINNTEDIKNNKIQTNQYNMPTNNLLGHISKQDSTIISSFDILPRVLIKASYANIGKTKRVIDNKIDEINIDNKPKFNFMLLLMWLISIIFCATTITGFIVYRDICVKYYPKACYIYNLLHYDVNNVECLVSISDICPQIKKRYSGVYISFRGMLKNNANISVKTPYIRVIALFNNKHKIIKYNFNNEQLAAKSRMIFETDDIFIPNHDIQCTIELCYDELDSV